MSLNYPALTDKPLTKTGAFTRAEVRARHERLKKMMKQVQLASWALAEALENVAEDSRNPFYDLAVIKDDRKAAVAAIDAILLS